MEDKESPLVKSRKRRARSRLILLIGIFLVFVSILFSILSSIDYRENKVIGKTEYLRKDQIIPISFQEFSGLGYSYLVDGTLEINTTKPVYVFYGNQSQYVANNAILYLTKNKLTIYIQALQDDTILVYSARYTVETKPYLALSIPSLFLVMVGAVFSFMGLLQYLISRKDLS